jgi:hypothetical protein
VADGFLRGCNQSCHGMPLQSRLCRCTTLNQRERVRVR